MDLIPKDIIRVIVKLFDSEDQAEYWPTLHLLSKEWHEIAKELKYENLSIEKAFATRSITSYHTAVPRPNWLLSLIRYRANDNNHSVQPPTWIAKDLGRSSVELQKMWERSEAIPNIVDIIRRVERNVSSWYLHVAANAIIGQHWGPAVFAIERILEAYKMFDGGRYNSAISAIIYQVIMDSGTSEIRNTPTKAGLLKGETRSIIGLSHGVVGFPDEIDNIDLAAIIWVIAASKRCSSESLRQLKRPLFSDTINEFIDSKICRMNDFIF